MADNRTTCLGILLVFVLSAVAMVTGGLHYLKKFGTANGVVVDAQTGDPIADAVVEIFASFPSTSGRSGDMPLTLHTETKEDGSWVLRQTVGGDYRLTIRHPDYAIYKREGVSLDAEGDTDLGTIGLEPPLEESSDPSDETGLENTDDEAPGGDDGAGG